MRLALDSTTLDVLLLNSIIVDPWFYRRLTNLVAKQIQNFLQIIRKVSVGHS